MRTKILIPVLAMTLSLVMACILPLAEANPVVYDRWQSGNAADECSEIGDYMYALKFNESGDVLAYPDEGAPNGTETALFLDGYGVVHSNDITISNSNGKVLDWSASPHRVGAVIVKAGRGAHVWFYEPQAFSDTGLYGYQNKDVGHVTFCWNPELEEDPEQWCSPGYWRQPHHLDSWEATGYSPDDLFHDALGYYPARSDLGTRVGAATDPTLLQVLQFPQYYGGEAFNDVGDLLSEAHPDVNFLEERVEDSCPLD